MTTPPPSSGHRPIDHTGDVAVELWAPSEEALLNEAAAAAGEIMLGGALGEPRAASGEERTIRLDTIDREDRLVQWLNEVIYLATREGLLVRGAAIDLPPAGGGGALVARARLDELDPGALATELKSATYHELRVERDRAGAWRARVVIDV